MTEDRGIPMTSYAWVIEARWQPIHYIGIRSVGRVFEPVWTDDHLQAMRFARKQDAEAMLNLLYERMYQFSGMVRGPGPAPIITEHAWTTT